MDRNVVHTILIVVIADLLGAAATGAVTGPGLGITKGSILTLHHSIVNDLYVAIFMLCQVLNRDITILALVKQAVRELFKKKIVRQFIQPLVEAGVQDAIHGTTPRMLLDEIGNIIKGRIWSYVKAGPLKLLSYLNKSMLSIFYFLLVLSFGVC